MEKRAEVDGGFPALDADAKRRRQAPAVDVGIDFDAAFGSEQLPMVDGDVLYEEMQIEQRFVGWLLGRGGGVIREYEQASGCRISINQDSREQGFSIVQLHGRQTERSQARILVEDSLLRARGHSGSSGNDEVLGGVYETHPAVETMLQLQVEQKWVGWLLGKGGGVAKEIEQECGARISIDQSTKQLGYSIVCLAGEASAVTMAKNRIQAQLYKVGGGTLASSSSAGVGTAQVQVEQQFVGWLLGKSGSVLKEIEAASGARVVMNQDTKALGYSTATISGEAVGVAQAKDLIEDKLRQVRPTPTGTSAAAVSDSRADSKVVVLADQLGLTVRQAQELDSLARISLEGVRSSRRQQLSASIRPGGAQPQRLEVPPPPRPVRHLDPPGDLHHASAAAVDAVPSADDQTIELKLDPGWAGWMLDKGGAIVREIEVITQAQISVDQGLPDQGYSLIFITGAPAAIIGAMQRLQASMALGQTFELAPASEGVEVVTVDGAGLLDPGGVQDTWAGVGELGETGALQLDALQREQADDGGSDIQVEQRLVGWLLGTRGVVLKEIESQSGARISIDQSTKALGYSTVHITGPWQAMQVARQLVRDKVTQAGPGMQDPATAILRPSL